MSFNWERFGWSGGLSDPDNFDDEPDSPAEAEKAKRVVKLVVLVVFGIFALQALIIWVLWRVLGGNEDKPLQAKTMVVLGSGGHTAEMMRLVEGLDPERFTPRTYVVARTDRLSGQKALQWEGERAAKSGSTPQVPPYQLFTLPRSREVGQSYATSVLTTLYAIAHAFWLVRRVKPELVLVNGPGTCIPICIAASFFRTIRVQPCRIVFVESIARTRTLSLSGKILYKLRIADKVLVQWEALQQRYPRTVCAGRLY